MALLLVVWVALFIAVLGLIARDKHRSGALTLSYFVSVSLIHIPGALTYVSSPVGAEDTVLGLQVTLVGLGMFVAGIAAAQLRGRRLERGVDDAPLDPAWLNDMGRKFFVIGVLAFFVLIPIIATIPSITAVASSLAGLVVIGIWLWLSAAIIEHNRRRLIIILAVLPVLPFATLSSIGFVSFSTQWIVTVLSFLFMMVRRKLVLLALLPGALYVALSMFVAYIGERDAIRDAVWYEEADLATRVERIGDIFVNFEWLDIGDPKHANALEGRLNQNWLVGAAVSNLQNGSVKYAYGGTLPLWALVPRAIWPDKPEVGGGRDVVSDYTGFVFPEATSVGAGQVLEFYVNFGIYGVMVGFFGWGFMLMRLDRSIMRAMADADMSKLLRRSMIGLTLLQPGGNLLEILVSAVGAAVATPAIMYLDRRLRALPLAIYSSKTKGLDPARAR
jgi:hypothetical protein